ncbi:MAG TPA: N-acetylmuramic acid 6-phosphate etherase, partial [Terriglobales bacterium]|nr:N-acetylmuramic acid 6-phosphate etherase [Terriglobales bacterium]
VNGEDAKVAGAVRRTLPQIARAIEAAAQAISCGGRVIYVGAGSSGRVAALDATEVPPTFNLDPKVVQYLIAGGEKALSAASEVSEDSAAAGQADMAKRRPSARDVVIGIAASGRTPYTIAALRHARKRRARTVALTSNRNSPLARLADIAIVPDVGPEVLSGSTRMKAGTAQKMVLNMISTGAMARLGYVYDNQMVHVSPKSGKLRERGIGIIEQLAHVSRQRALRTLKHSANSVPVALVSLLGRVDAKSANRHLGAANGNLRRAIAAARESGK